MRKSSILFLIITLVFINFTCKRGPSARTELIDGIQHVFNTETPIRGKISLDVVEVLKVDPFKIDPQNPPSFQMAAKDSEGNLYLGDGQNVRVCKLDSRGNLIVQFLRKGQGPGEFPRFGDLQVADNHLWVIGTWPTKIAQLTLDGEYLNEWLFRTFQNFYLQTQVISEDRFLTVSYRGEAGGQDRTRVSALINATEEFLAQYYEDKNAGIFRIRAMGQAPAIASTNPLVASDIHHAYDRNSSTIYVCNNREYEIQAKNYDGTTRLVIHKAHKKIILDEDEKERIIQSIASRLPLEVRQSAKEQLPDTLNAILGIAVLPAGHLAVKRITGLESVEIDVFDRNGFFITTILPSAEVPDLRGVIILGNTIGMITELEEKSLFTEYRVNNMKGIFD